VIIRDENGIAHIAGLSGGHDSTSMCLQLNEREPRPYNYLCTPTGNELPEMFQFWQLLGDLLGRRLIPIMNGTLSSVIAAEGMLPNIRARFCTRILKIVPYRDFLIREAANGPIVSYVGLRADEPGRAGGVYDDIPGVTMRFPLREWGQGEDEVQADLAARGVKCPDRTDCAWCYHQRLGEWWELWWHHRELYMDAERLEIKMGHTFRTPGRDSWPSSLRELRLRFEAGDVPDKSLNRMMRERQLVGSCRVCRL